MRARRGIAHVLASAVALAVAAGGCSLIVSGDVPEYKCSLDAPTVCPAGLRCDTAAQRCVSDEDGAAVEPAEAGDEQPPIDAGEGGKADGPPAGPLDNGAQCRVDAECKSKLCGSSTILTTAITQTTGPICTSPCCTSAECGPSFVCFNGGTGGGYCVPAALAKRSPPATGGKQGGSACTSNVECRSGLCTGTPATCLDTCCVATDCQGSTTCRLKAVAAPAPSHDVWVCAPPAGAKLPGEPCVDNNECTTDNCIGFGAPASRVCRPPCSNSASCRVVPGFEDGHCLYNGAAGSDYFKFCYVQTTSTDLAAGAACINHGDCQSDYCDAELKKCANVCAKDSDCAAKEACRPSAVNTPYLRCVARP